MNSEAMPKLTKIFVINGSHIFSATPSQYIPCYPNKGLWMKVHLSEIEVTLNISEKCFSTVLINSMESTTLLSKVPFHQVIISTINRKYLLNNGLVRGSAHRRIQVELEGEVPVSTVLCCVYLWLCFSPLVL